jgi:hypothetical protein
MIIKIDENIEIDKIQYFISIYQERLSKETKYYHSSWINGKFQKF